MVIYCDNTSAINISKKLVMHMKTKHISIKYHYLREFVKEKEVRMKYVNTKEQLVDIFTKALPKEAHEYLRGKLGVIPLSQAAWRESGALCQPSWMKYLTFDTVGVTLGAA